MSPWGVEAPCTPACVTDAVPYGPSAGAGRRYAALAATLVRSVAMRERLTDPPTLRAQARAVLTVLGVRLDPAEGREPLVVPGPTGTLIVANHISWLDVITLLAIDPTVTFLAKREVATWPVVGLLARRLGAHFIDRDGLRELPYAVAELAQELRSGRSVVVFPQATTWCSVAGGTFRPATFQAAIDAGAPVRPVTIDYFQHSAPSTVAAFVGDEGFGTCLRRVAGARELSVRVTTHRPISGDDRRLLAAEARRTVSDAKAPAHV